MYNNPIRWGSQKKSHFSKYTKPNNKIVPIPKFQISSLLDKSTKKHKYSLSLPKLTSAENKKKSPSLQKSLLYLGWDTERKTNNPHLPYIQQKKSITLQPKKNVRTYRKFTTDADEGTDQSYLSDNKQESEPLLMRFDRVKRQNPQQIKESPQQASEYCTMTIENKKQNKDIKQSKPFKAKIEYKQISEKLLSSQEQKDSSQSFDKVSRSHAKTKNLNLKPNTYKHKLMSMNIQSTTLSDCVKQEKDKKTVFDQLNKQQKKQFYKSQQVSKQTKFLTQLQIKSKELLKIPRRQQIFQFIDSYSSLDESFKFPVGDDNLIIVWGKRTLYIGMSKIKQGKRIRHGSGMFLTEHSHFQGQFCQNYKKQGFQARNNGIFRGQFKNNKRQGQGEFIWFNGQYFNGQWKNNQKHGSGIWTSSYRSQQPDSYIGEWKDGKVHGYGVHTWKNGANRYQGQFINFLKHGKGVQRFDNGDKYEGSYKNGKPEGYGEYYWVDGSSYKGNFQDGLRQGVGVYYQPKGNKYEGQYRNDCKHGDGSIYYTDGSVFKGKFVANKKQGEGQLITRVGETIKGSWKDGKLIELF